MTDLKPNGRIRLTAVLPADQLDAAADSLGKCLLSLGVYPSEVTVKAGDIDMTLHHANRPKAPKQLVSAKDLPVPRLELRWNSPEEAPPEGYPSGTQVCRYLLVIPLGKWDVRREDEDCEQVRDVHEVELGQTIRTGGFRNLVWPESQTVDTPYRAQSHAAWDSRALGLPAYATSGEQAMFIEPREPSA